MIHFNDPEYDEQRKATRPLHLKEEFEVIDFINSLISKSDEENSKKVELLQRFVHHYENLAHGSNEDGKR